MTVASAGLAAVTGQAAAGGYPLVYGPAYNTASIVTLRTGVIFDSVGPSSSGATVTSGKTLSWTHTPVRAATVVLAAVAAGISVSGIDSHGSCTYGGMTMTWLGWVHSGNANNGYAELFGLAAPPPGPQSVAYTATTTGTVSSLIGGSLAYTGSGNTTGTAFGTPAAAFGTSATGSVSVTGSAVTNMIAGCFASGTGSQVVTAGTLRWARNLNATSEAGNSFGSDISSAAGVVTLSGSWTSDLWGAVAVEVLASTGVTVVAGVATLTGAAEPTPGGSILVSYTSSPGLAVPGMFTPGATGILTSTLTPIVTANTGVATGTVTASTITPALIFTGPAAALAGTAQTPVPAVTATAGLAALSGAALTIASATQTGLATLTGNAVNPAAAVGGGTIADPPVVTVTASAQPPVPVVVTFPGAAAITGAAQTPVPVVTANASAATLTGTAGPVAYFHANAGTATLTGAAQIAASLIRSATGTATGTGTSQKPASCTVQPAAALASLTGVSQGTAKPVLFTLTVGPTMASVATGATRNSLNTAATLNRPAVSVATSTSVSLIAGPTAGGT